MNHNPKEIWINGRHYTSIAEGAAKENLNRGTLNQAIYKNKGKKVFPCNGSSISFEAPSKDFTEQPIPKTPAAPKKPAKESAPDLSDSETADLAAQFEALRKDFRSLQVALLKTKGQLRTMAAEIGNLKEALADRESA